MKSIILTGLDVGSGSVKGLCCRKDLKRGNIEVLSQAESPCFGVRNGEVVKPEQVSKSIHKVKLELSRKKDFKVRDVLVNVSGSHLFSLSSQGIVSVSRADQKISREDVQRVLKAAEAVNIPSNKEILQVFTKEYIIDGEAGIKDPLGLQGIRLESRVLLVGIFSPILDNLENAVHGAGLRIADRVLSPLACARAVLTKEQKELGVALLDIGFGCTSLSVFEKGDLVDFVSFPLGSSNITNDIAIALRTEIQTAEEIKRRHACFGKHKKGSKEKIKIPEKELEFSKKFLRDIVESRMAEIFSHAQKALKKISGDEPLPSGVILTGGGSKLPGIADFGKQRFKLPCKKGEMHEIKGIEDERFAVCCGLILTGFDMEEKGAERKPSSGAGQKIKRIFKSFLP